MAKVLVVTSGKGGVGKSTAAAAVTAGGGNGPCLLGRVDMRHQYAGSTRIEHGKDVGVGGLADPDDAGDVGRPRCEDHGVEDGLAEGGVLLIKDDEVEPQQSQNLSCVGGRRLDECSENVLFRLQTAAEVAVWRTVWRHARSEATGTGRRLGPGWWF